MQVDDSSKDLRDFRRLQVKLDREKDRNAVHDGKRIGLKKLRKKECVKITENDIKGLAGRIKRKKHAAKEDLVKLSQGFLEFEENIVTFCKITGAINVIVKELTGKNSDQRLKASECLCNLSLGNEVCCEKIALLAGTYLATYIENVMSHGLSVTCLWTLQNLAASGPKPLQILKSQVIGPKLVHILDDCINEEIKSECFLLMNILLSKGKWEILEREFVEVQILPMIIEADTIESVNKGKLLYNLLYELEYKISTDQQLRIAQISMETLFKTSSTNLTNKQRSMIHLMVRILGNFCALNYAIEEISNNISAIIETFNNLSSNQELSIIKEFLWFLGNLIGQIQSQEILGPLENGLKIPKTFL